MPLSSAIVSLLKKSRKLHSHPFDKVRPFCTQTDPAATRRRWSSFFDDETETESSVYKHALKFQRPSTIVYTTQPMNSVSLIGTVTLEMKRINTRYHSNFGVHTLLKVKASTQSKNSFLVMLMMWDEMAEISANHLKPNDFVYVWGHLGSYMKADKNSDPRIAYKVTVREINYVAENSEKPIYHKPNKLDFQDYLERDRNRLHLWQVFFANPYEWKDNRRSKVNIKYPDFKNISTGEALWLQHDDPPWVKRQLQLLDSELAGVGVGVRGRDLSSASCWSLLGNYTLQENGESWTGLELK